MSRSPSFRWSALVWLLAAAPLAAQVVDERVDLDVVRRVREEGLTRSQLPALAEHLTDVIGPRLTGSSGMNAANAWTAQQLRDWGLANVAVEPWGRFGRGWERVSLSGRILTPFVQPLQASALAWSGSTRGTVTGPAVYASINDTADFAQYRGKLRGAFVLLDTALAVEPEWTRNPLRTPLEDLLEPPAPRAGANQVTPERIAEIRARFRAQRELRQKVAQFLRVERVAALLSFTPRQYTILSPQGSLESALVRDSLRYEPLPAVQLSQEQYFQIYRNLQHGVPVRLELNVQNRLLAGDLQAYNTVAEIPGTDLKDQVVMLGAHLDSWFGGTGATDNGAGSVVMMEAMRILKTLGLQPRRTVRIALWSGEEQGLLGSEAWVANHKAELDHISVYVNVDNGTGKIRGIWDQSNAAVIPIFEQILWPFRDLGVVAVKHGNTGGTDHLSFDRAGVPGFNFIQDPIEYSSRTHHSDADTYERLVLSDLEQAATVVAYTVYHLAMRDEMMPRKPTTPATGN